MTLLRLCVRWCYWRIRVARQERAPTALGPLTRAWVRLCVHPAATLRLGALWRGLREAGNAVGGAIAFVPVVGPLASLTGGGLAGLGAASGLTGSGFAARQQAEAMRDLLRGLQAQQASSVYAQALANRHLDPGPLAGLLGNVGAAHGEIRIGGGITAADLHRSGLWHTGFEAHRRAEALRDSLATLEGQDHSPLVSAPLAWMLANRNRT